MAGARLRPRRARCGGRRRGRPTDAHLRPSSPPSGTGCGPIAQRGPRVGYYRRSADSITVAAGMARSGLAWGCTTWEGRVPAPASQRSHASTNLRRPLSRPATHTLRESSCAIRPIPSQYNPLFPRPDPRPNVPHPTHPSQTSSQTGPRNHLPLCHTSPHAPPHPSARPPSRPPALSLWARRRPSVTDRPRFVFSCLITVTHTNLPYPPCDLVARTLHTNTLPNSANFIH